MTIGEKESQRLPSSSNKKHYFSHRGERGRHLRVKRRKEGASYPCSERKKGDNHSTDSEKGEARGKDV